MSPHRSNIPPAIIVRDAIQFAAPSPTGRTRGALPAGAASQQGMKGDVMKSPRSNKKTTATQSEDNFEVNESNYLDITIQDVKGAVNSVKYGFDEMAAQNLIRYFHYRLKNGCLFDGVRLEPKERAFIDYVEHVFARMVEQKKSPEVAFGLAPGRGEHQREDTTERDVIAAAYVILHRRNNWTLADAQGIVANFLFPEGNGMSAVKAAYAKFKNEFSCLEYETLLSLMPDNIPAIKPYMK